MKMLIAFVLNIFIPGLGSIILGNGVQGTIQIILTFMSFVLFLTAFFALFGIYLFVLTWLWSLVLWILYLNRKIQSNSKPDAS